MIASYPGRNPVAEVLGGRISLREFRVLVKYMPPGNALDIDRGLTLPANHVLLNIESRLRDLYAQQVNMWRDKGTPEYRPPYLLASDDDEELAAELDEAEKAELDEIWFPKSPDN